LKRGRAKRTVNARKSISSMKMPMRFWMALMPLVDRPEPRYIRPRRTGGRVRGREGGKKG